ncbi:hypothetical protein Sme01_12360 [Sphaerisporangium melleum]|uniref:Uncharacterized protein n=1 Tax=Sphaerisporangium melleum TaxID=321316 RepID=A0A917RJF3_9ACTN|nr:hypothetical protein [Sphaerisporangium melleum]GGL09012.1 hypothetical protein GCM10007964_59060 [Sphaerisporangium melleum]GII68760.1 hypothetical protein Sme01_12360 [Sphaerisporangium melleum]
MSFLPTWSNEIPFIRQELVRDRIRTLHHEAEQQRLVLHLMRVKRARKRAERASLRLRHALTRLA